ncbi:hypothetical protein [Legionella impletisoli]|uniref:PIK helical domain-containing protein n=1 Tax=Legionella impletisoli TaxID=343510 RepID=A0A917NA79_9GAMM|nr:hypothetical protein [Legionella impletisoli]GGI82343.1 hypothetical protein GCM10007966_08620 [Legionella impletisoli]
MSFNSHNDSTLLRETIQSIRALPSNEFNYYLTLMVSILEQNPDVEQRFIFLKKIRNLTIALQAFFQLLDNHENTEHCIQQITQEISDLVRLAHLNSIGSKLRSVLQMTIGLIAAVVVGLSCMVVGFGLGLFFHSNPFKGCFSGLQVGLGLGIILGYMLPKKLLTSKLTLKLEFCLNSLKQLNAELNVDRKTHEDYQRETKQALISKFFADFENPELAFETFLHENQTYEICTTPSGLIDREFDGSLGHHTLIRYQINGQWGIPMEFGDRLSSPNWIEQAETRTVKGQLLFDMLTLDRKLATTHPKNLRFVWNKYKAGSNDCLTYTDKITIGTKQAPTNIKRFHPKLDTWFGTHILAPIFRFISVISEHDLSNTSKLFSYSDASQITFFGKSSKNKPKGINNPTSPGLPIPMTNEHARF